MPINKAMAQLIVLVLGFCGTSAYGISSEQSCNNLLSRQVEAQIRQVIDDAVARSTGRSNDVKVITHPILVSNAQLQYVEELGTAAVVALTKFASSNDAQAQEVAMRLLGQFKGDDAIAGFAEFALHATNPGTRDLAVAWLKGFDIARTRAILQQVAKEDPEARVRAHASRLLSEPTTCKE
jgi:uncharacterized membrane protein